jgi:Cu(I)/Ag(I) efflux system periplasmic protein CusF
VSTKLVAIQINLDQGKVTLKHGPIKNLDMPGMTMAFRVKDKSILNGIAVGDRVIFTADRIENEIIVNSISKQ